MTRVACPTEAELTRYCLGALPSEQIETVSVHIDHCADCSDRLTEIFRRSDPLADAVRQAAQVERFSSAVVSPPTTLRDYRLEDVLGEGGMGTVYRAMHTRLGRPVALKLLTASRRLDPDAGARFEREMKAIGALRHPNIVQATDAGEADGVPFLVMELIGGRDLGRLVKEHGPMSALEACDAVRQAALGLQHAHEHGLVHRDVKPSNLMRTPDGTVKVLDLGLARNAWGSDSNSGSPETTIAGVSDLTDLNTRVGTERFMAPEQRLSPGHVGPQADVFALGRTLCFLLHGSPDLPSPEKLPAGIFEIVERMQAQGAADRYPTAQAVADALEPFCPQSPKTALAEGKHHNLLWFILAVSVLITVATIAVAMMRSPRTDPPEDPGPAAQLLGKEPPMPGQLGITSEAAIELQKVHADFLGVERFDTNSQGMRLALIPPGELNISPVTHVRITKPYFLGVTEVTRAQFRAFVEKTGHKTEAEKQRNGRYMWYVPTGKLSGGSRSQTGPNLNWLAPGYPDPTDDEPVTQLSWLDAVAYCEHMSKIDGKKYRLPTFSESVWASRAGTSAKFPGGTDLQNDASFLEEYACTDRLSPKRPYPVGKLKANAWGLYDTVGNVSEWVQDWFGEFPGGTFENYVGPSAGQFRMKHGPSYVMRNGFGLFGAIPPDWSNSTIGFRVLREP